SRSSEALILSINQLILAQEGMSCMTVDEIGVSLCSINRRRETSRSVMDPFTMITTIDSRVTLGDHQLGTQTHTVTDIAVDVGSLLLRLGINDIILLMDIFNTAMELLYKSNTSQQGQEQEQEQGRAEAGKRKITAVSSGQAAVQQSGGSTPASAVTPVPAAAAASRLGSSTLGSESAASAPATLRKTRASSSVRDSPDMSTRPSARIIKETMRATVASMRVVIIRDMSGLPVYACSSKEFHVDVTDWSVNMRVKSDLQLQMSYFNRRNSHWEPFVEPWSCALNVVSSQGELGDQMTQKIDINSTDRLHLNVSHAFIETTLSLISQWGDEMERHKKHQKEGTKPVGERMPYVLINRTGIDCHVWVDLPEGIAARSEGIDTSPVLLRDGESLPWRFEDWRRRREQLEAKSHHLGIQFANGQWEWLRRVQVDCEGVKHYSLQPPVDDILHRVAVEVTLDSVNLVKRVVLRSPLVVENQTRVAMEVSMCDYRGELRTDSTVIQPGEELPLPIMFCHQYAVRARPEAGFGYAWSSRYIYWRDFLGQDARTELCCLPNATATALHQSQRAQSHAGEGEVYGGGRNTGGSAYRGSELDADVMPFFIHFNALCDARNPSLYKYPFMRLVMTPPLEIENLLPYAMSICVIDKTANRKWVSSLKRGGISPVHAVQPGHLVLLSARIPDAGFDLCEGTIIESNDEDEYPADTDLVMTDREGLKLALKIHRMDIPNSGGRCRRISIYAP
ncbi:Vacuolar protein sorting-associated protein 13, partial [Dipsacomyces acuminosporus]